MVRKLKSKEGRIEEVVLADVLTDDSYQRDVQRHVRFIVEEFDPAAVGTGTVACRSDGKLYWIDGLQRCTAMRQLGLTKWRCTVLESPGPKYEAHVFRLLNSRESRRSLNQNQLYKAALVEEDPTALAVKRASEAAGLRVGMSRESGTSSYKGWPIINSAGLLLRVCKSYGEQTLADALKLLADTWPQVDDALHQGVIGAVCMIVYNYGAELDRGHFVAALGKAVPRALILNTKGVQGGGSVSGAVADEMIARYNKGRHGKRRLKLFRERRVEGEATKPIERNLNLDDVSRAAGV